MKKNKKKAKHPTLFVFDGTIMYFEEGTMLELHSQVAQDEWEQIVEQTVKYKVFVECLKTVAMPILGERWDEEDDWFRVQLDVAVSRMRNIDPLLVSSHNQTKITEIYSKQMKANAVEVQGMVTEVRESQKKALSDRYGEFEDDGDTAIVSDL